MDRIGKYIIEKKLGQGGMGIVYKCLDSESRRPAAVKVLPQQLAGDPAFLQRFKREVLTLQRLNHPFIVRVYDQGETDGSWYYAMEYVEGGTLDALLDGGAKLDPLRAIQIMRGCAEALEHSHSQGVVHRDIKPANIMLPPDGGVKLTDFGIAKVLDATRMTATQGILGTVEYMSPEQSQGKHVDARSDMYSLGVVFYQCLTGRLPITGTTPTEIIMKLRTHQVDPPSEWIPGLPRSLDALVMRMLAKEPSGRTESARELLRELERVERQLCTGIGGHGPVASEDPILTSEEEPPPLWRNPWLILIGIILISFSLWMHFRPASQPVEIAPETETTVGNPQLMLRWAQGARRKKKYDYAMELCHFIIKHHPNSKQEELAQQLLEEIPGDIEKDLADAVARPTEREGPLSGAAREGP